MRARRVLVVMGMFTAFGVAVAEESAAADEAPPAESTPPPIPQPEASPPQAPAGRPGPIRGLEVGIRVAYALPRGDLAGLVGSSEVAAFQDEFAKAIPATLEVGLRLSERLTIAGYYSRGEVEEQPDALIGQCAAPGTSCTRGMTARFGAEALYRLTDGPALSPWVGVGVGYERTGFDVNSPPAPDAIDAVTYKGFDLSLQVGADFFVSRRFYVGPYALATFGRFTKFEGVVGGTEVELEFAEPRIHSWLMLGLRGGFAL